MDTLINEALAWSARLGWPLTRHEVFALAALALVVALVMVRLLFKVRRRLRGHGRIEVRAARIPGKISDAFDFLKREGGPTLSIEEINEIAARGWAGKR